VKEVKDKLNQNGNSCRGPAATLCIARGIAIKPEVLAARRACSRRSDLTPHRGVDGRTEARLHRGDRDSQHAAGGARFDYTAYMYLGEMIEFARPTIFRQTPAQGNRGLHHGRCHRSRCGSRCRHPTWVGQVGDLDGCMAFMKEIRNNTLTGKVLPWCKVAGEVFRFRRYRCEGTIFAVMTGPQGNGDLRDVSMAPTIPRNASGPAEVNPLAREKQGELSKSLQSRCARWTVWLLYFARPPSSGSSRLSSWSIPVRKT